MKLLVILFILKSWFCQMLGNWDFFVMTLNIIYKTWNILTENPDISEHSGNYFGTDYASNLFAPMLLNFLINKKRSNKGVNWTAKCQLNVLFFPKAS